MGPMVWELEGPIPTLKMSKTLRVMELAWARNTGSEFTHQSTPHDHLRSDGACQHVLRRQAGRSIATGPGAEHPIEALVNSTVWVLAPATYRRSVITTAQAPQCLPAVLVRALVRSCGQSVGNPHPLREFAPAGLARRAFYIT